MADTDIFLSVEGQKSGKIKGESQDDDHKGEIEVISWSWGMRAQTDISGGVIGKRTIDQLRITKRVDSASCPLMNALSANEMIKKAVLAVRKAGKTQQEFFRITIENGRVTSCELQAPDPDGGAEMVESVSFSFQKIEIVYRRQGEDGQLLGSMTFLDEIYPS